MTPYEVVTLSEEETALLRRIYEDLMALSGSRVPSVRASARAAVAHVAQAMNGEGIAFELYTGQWTD